MIAIIMATYNGEEYLREQLDSLFQNTCQDWKLYLFDDGSTDGTIEIAKTYQKAYPGRIMIRSNPKNLKSARNFLPDFVRYGRRRRQNIICSVTRMIAGIRIKLSVL